MTFDRKTIFGVVFAVLPFVLVLPLQFTGRLRGFENSLIDARHKYFNAGHAHANDVVIADIDERTLNSYRSDPLFGRWPWRRNIYGPILRYIAEGGPKIILVDIRFTESSPDDGDLAGETKEVAEVIPLSHALQFTVEGDATHEALPDFIHRKSYPVIFEDFQPRAYDTLQFPAGNISADNKSLLHSVRYWSDPDAISRMAEPVFKFGPSSFLFLPMQGFFSLFEPGVKLQVSTDKMRITGRRAGKDELVTVPLEDGKMRINYYERWVYDATAKDSLHRISMSGIIESIRARNKNTGAPDVVPPEMFQDKIVILATSASGTFDEKLTPHGALPGYVIHATLLSNLIAGHFLVSGSALWGFAVSALLLAVTAFFVLRFHLMIVRVAVPATLFVLCAAGAVIAFHHDYALYFAPIPLTFIPGYIGMLGVLTYFEGMEKRRFRGAMAKYLSPDVLEEVMKRGQLKAEVGERRVLTVLFSDVRGFTTMSENMDAGQVVEILNEYFSHMVKIIFDNKGTLDKFIGDAIMAFWGAPIPREDHAVLAVRSALAMTAALRSLNAEFVERGVAPLSIGIGVHTGEMIVGNIGSDQRLDYTLIGDHVNLGSRVESLTKQYGVEILITQAARDQLAGAVPCRMIDLVAVKGKAIPVPVLEPIDHAYAGMSPGEIEQAFETAFGAYRNREWGRAISLYRALSETRPGGDLTCRTLIDRCEYYKGEPPAMDWDGSYVMKTK